MSQIAHTSRMAYKTVQDQLHGLRLEVWQAIRDYDGSPSIEDLAHATGRKESSICGRIDELRKAGAISESACKDQHGRQVKTYKVLLYQYYEPQPVIREDATGQFTFA